MSLDKPVADIVGKNFETYMRAEVQRLINAAIDITLQEVRENLVVRFVPSSEKNSFTVEFTWREGVLR